MQGNRLIHEKSPYLLQHAHNPVDWYPWGDEAFQKAMEENKPVFLSVGYSTCHWCHVMEHESFENAGIAEYLNSNFVSIKVDREERPDIDRVYMNYVQATTGSGGWPMSVWLTPAGRPFLGGTYFPPENRYGRPGFPLLLERITKAWREEPDKIAASASNVMAELERLAKPPDGRLDPQSSTLESAFFAWRRSFDSQLGGFGSAPKFPRPVIFNFLLRYYSRTGNEEALEMTLTTLKAMANGGMNDQLGGGFHRYSVDEYWFVPHFEKMLYDQAQIGVSLIESYQITRDETLAAEARRVFDYVLRDMTDPAGGFFSAEDADSVADPERPEKKAEGAFYIWSADEIAAAGNEAAVRYFNYYFGVEPDGNVRSDPHGEFTGRNILFRAHTFEEAAHHFDRPLEEVTAAISELAQTLFRKRKGRVRPHLDDKVLTAWNGLMISALAKAGAALGEERYAAAANRAATFLGGRMWNPEKRELLRRYRKNDAAIGGFLDDYAFFAQGLLDLYEAQLDFRSLQLAIDLSDRALELFADRENGGLFATTEEGDARLPLRLKDEYDGAEPSGNSVAVLNLLRLERLTGRTELGDFARKTLRAYSERLAARPSALPQLLCALEFSLSTPQQIVLAGERETPETHAMLALIHSKFRPNQTILLVDSESRDRISRWKDGSFFTRPTDGGTAAYICENFVCNLPAANLDELAGLLQ